MIILSFKALSIFVFEHILIHFLSKYLFVSINFIYVILHNFLLF